MCVNILKVRSRVSVHSGCFFISQSSWSAQRKCIPHMPALGMMYDSSSLCNESMSNSVSLTPCQVVQPLPIHLFTLYNFWK